MRNAIIAIVVLAALALGGYYLAADRSESNNGEPSASGTFDASPKAPVKEFTMTSYFDPAIQKPLFSLKEVTVNRGDRVKIKVTNTMGTHNFYLDEYGIKQDTPLNQEVVVEFTASKAGEFIYYCNMPGHRAAGQWGTLKVL